MGTGSAAIRGEPSVTYYRRVPLGPAGTGIAILAGAAVGLAAFYLARVWLQREPLIGSRGGQAAASAGAAEGVRGAGAEATGNAPNAGAEATESAP